MACLDDDNCKAKNVNEKKVDKSKIFKCVKDKKSGIKLKSKGVS